MSAYKTTILNLVVECGYPTNVRDLIVSTILEVITSIKGSKFFKFTSNNDNILVIRIPLLAQFGGNSYTIQILTYLTRSFPFSAPEIFVEKTSDDMGINPNNKNIDPKNGKIMTAGLFNWNSYSSLINVINEISCSFNQVFPVYQIKHRPSQPERTSIQNMQQMDSSYVSTSTGDISHISTGMSQIQINSDVNELVRQTLICEIKENMYSRVKLELDSQIRDKNNLLSIKQSLINQIQNYTNFKNNYLNCSKQLESVINSISYQSKSLKDELNQLKIKIGSNQNIWESVYVGEKKILKLISMEACLEDLISFVKKAFARELISLEDCLKFLRSAFREVFKIRTARENHLLRYRK
jgi:hypothetical protein